MNILVLHIFIPIISRSFAKVTLIHKSFALILEGFALIRETRVYLRRFRVNLRKVFFSPTKMSPKGFRKLRKNITKTLI